MPNQPKTVAHTVRVEADLWATAMTKARTSRENVSDIVRRALRNYTDTQTRSDSLDELTAITGNAAIALRVHQWHEERLDDFSTNAARLAALRHLHRERETGECGECYDWGGSAEKWPCETAWILGAHLPGVNHWKPEDPTHPSRNTDTTHHDDTRETIKT